MLKFALRYNVWVNVLGNVPPLISSHQFFFLALPTDKNCLDTQYLYFYQQEKFNFDAFLQRLKGQTHVCRCDAPIKANIYQEVKGKSELLMCKIFIMCTELFIRGFGETQAGVSGPFPTPKMHWRGQLQFDP